MNPYDVFVKNARAAFFTDDQIDFLWDWLLQTVEDPKVFLDQDNYAQPLEDNQR